MNSGNAKKIKCSAVPTVPPVFTVSCCYTNDLHKDTTIVNIAQLTKPSRASTEHDSDSTVLNFKREMSGLPTDEQLLVNDARLMPYYGRKKKRFVVKDDILCRRSWKSESLTSPPAWTLTQCCYNHYREQLVNNQASQR